MDLEGLDQEGLIRIIGELQAANRATQANFDEIRQQFPIQSENLSNDIPDFSELEEGGLMYMGEEGPEALEPGEDGEVLEAYKQGGKKKLRWAPASFRSGETVLEWPGETPRTDLKTISHNLGKEPRRVLVAVAPSGLVVESLVNVGCSFKDDTRLSLEASRVDGTSPAAGVKVNVNWIVIP